MLLFVHLRPGARMTVSLLTHRSRCCSMVLLSLASLPGCTGWRIQNVSPVQELKQPVPYRLRVQLKDGRTVYLRSARVENDSLVGIERAEDAPGRPAGRSAFALSDVARTEALKTKVAASLFIIGGVAAVGTFLALASAFASNY